MKRIFALLSLSLLLFVPLSSLTAKEVITYTAGLAVADKITQDENEFISLDGIFNVITFTNFPGVTDFSVYSRWIGSGKHTTKIQIVDNEGNIVNDSDETLLEFNRTNSTYYQYFDFNNTVFTKPGVYWVQTILDGKIDFSIPLFIESKDTKLVVKGLPKEPVIILSVPANSIREQENGLPIISGVFESFSSRRFPCAYDFLIVNLWCSGEGEFSQFIELIDPDNRVIYKSDPISFEQLDKGLSIIYDTLEDVIFFKPGEYTVNVYLGDKIAFTYPILVIQK